MRSAKIIDWYHWIAGIFLLVISIASPAQTEIETLESGGKELQHFIGLMRNNLAAWSFHKDDAVFDEAAPDYTNRPDAIFWDTAPPLQGFRGWKEYSKAAENWSKNEIDQANISVIDPEHFKAWRYKDLVWNIMHCGIGLTFASGEKADQLCRGTLIWEWEDDRWKLAHEVFSAPVGPGDSVFQGKRPEDPRIKPDIELMDRARQLASAWGFGSTRGLAKRLQEFYVDDDKLSIYTPWHPFIAYQGWQAFEQGLKRYIAASIKHINIELNNDLEAQRRDKIAWSTATLHIETELVNGETISGDARQTLIWYQAEDGWRVLHEHFSFPQ